jgi:hypothetical protein
VYSRICSVELGIVSFVMFRPEVSGRPLRLRVVVSLVWTVSYSRRRLWGIRGRPRPRISSLDHRVRRGLLLGRGKVRVGLLRLSRLFPR